MSSRTKAKIVHWINRIWSILPVFCGFAANLFSRDHWFHWFAPFVGLLTWILITVAAQKYYDGCPLMHWEMRLKRDAAKKQEAT